MTVFCWGNLGKSADDSQRIEEAIQAYVENHDANPNAHMGEDYALGAHRLMVEIDHLPYSAKNALLYPTARTYQMIVDIDGGGDTDDIQTAINTVHAMGGGKILIKNGTYNLTSNLTLYSNIDLIGDDKTDTILDFGTNEYSIIINGKYDVVVNNLTVQNTPYFAFDLNDCNSLNINSINISNCGTGFNLSGYIKNSNFENLTFNSMDYTCFYIDITHSFGSYNIFKDIFADTIGSYGVEIYSGYNLIFQNMFLYNLGSAGFYIESDYMDYTILSNCNVSYCTTDGFSIWDLDRVMFNSCVAHHCDNNGFKISGVSECSFVGCHAHSNGAYGFNLSNTTSRNIVDGCVARNNVSGNLLIVELIIMSLIILFNLI